MASMDVSAVSGIQSLNFDPTAPAVAPSTDPLAPQAESVQISERGQLMQKLSDLAKSDPAKFKEVSQKIADGLKQAESTSNDPRLAKLADAFTSAAQTGQMPSLAPPQAPSNGSGAHAYHHHHHSGGGSSSGSGSGQGSTATGTQNPDAQTIESVISQALAS